MDGHKLSLPEGYVGMCFPCRRFLRPAQGLRCNLDQNYEIIIVILIKGCFSVMDGDTSFRFGPERKTETLHRR